MKFHIIVDKVEGNEGLGFLVAAAEGQGIAANVVEAAKVDYFSLPLLEIGDLLFRQGLSERSKQVEQMIISDEVAHFYKDAVYAIGRRACSYFYNEQTGLPVIKTIPLLPTWESDMQKHVDYLGGFPLVMKVLGGSDGVGVMQIDSIEGLKSTVDYVRDLKGLVLLRSFVQHDYYGRLIVVGDKVVASHRTYSVDNEFRTNALGNTDERKEKIDFSPEAQQAAVDAVRSLGVEFGGVDLLFSDDGTFHISEVNSPCAFYHTQKITGTDVAGEMVSYLAKKAQENLLK